LPGSLALLTSELGIEDGLKQHFERFFETGTVARGALAIALRFKGKHPNRIAVWAWGHGSTSSAYFNQRTAIGGSRTKNSMIAGGAIPISGLARAETIID
jgi:hypothetical protein